MLFGLHFKKRGGASYAWLRTRLGLSEVGWLRARAHRELALRRAPVRVSHSTPAGNLFYQAAQRGRTNYILHFTGVLD